MGTLIIGFIFAAFFLWAGQRAYVDMKKGKCSGCSSCNYAKKNGGCQLEDNDPNLITSKKA